METRNGDVKFLKELFEIFITFEQKYKSKSKIDLKSLRWDYVAFNRAPYRLFIRNCEEPPKRIELSLTKQLYDLFETKETGRIL